MNDNLSIVVAKALATAGASVAVFGLSWWALAAALVGAFASYHFEPEQRPRGLGKMLFGIFAMAFAAAMLAVAAPAVPLFVWTGQIAVEVRAGLLGLTIRFIYEQGKRLTRGYKSSGV